MGIFFSKKKIQDNFRHVGELRRLGTKRDQESYSPDKLDVCNVESKLAEDYWELDLIWFVVPSYLKTRLEQGLY